MATKKWQRDRPQGGISNVRIDYVVLNGGDTSEEIIIPHYADKTIHIYGGTFGNSTVSLKGTNLSSGTPLDLHRTNDATLTFTGVASALLAHVIENPLIFVASADGSTGTNLTVLIVSTTTMF